MPRGGGRQHTRPPSGCRGPGACTPYMHHPMAAEAGSPRLGDSRTDLREGPVRTGLSEGSVRTGLSDRSACWPERRVSSYGLSDSHIPSCHYQARRRAAGGVLTHVSQPWWPRDRSTFGSPGPGAGWAPHPRTGPRLGGRQGEGTAASLACHGSWSQGLRATLVAGHVAPGAAMLSGRPVCTMRGGRRAACAHGGLGLGGPAVWAPAMGT